MKVGGLLTALGALVILGGLVFWTVKHPSTDSKTAATVSPKIISVEAKDIEGLEIAKAGSEPLVLAKLADKWEIAKPSPMPADQDAVGAIANALAALNADRLIDEHPANLGEFGLTTPSSEIQITLKGGKKQKLQLGGDTPSGGNTYAKLEGDSKVYTVASFAKATFDKSVNDLRDKRLLTFNQEKLTSLTIAAKGPAFELGKNAQGDWQITKPKVLRADGPQVDELIRKLKDAKMDLPNEALPGAGAAAQFAGGTKSGIATVTDASGTQTLEVHKGKDGSYYAKSSVVEGIYKIVGDVGDGMDKAVDDFRNKKLFDFGFNDPSKVDIGGKLYQKSGDKWTAGGAQFDGPSVQAVIDKLRDLSATKFSDKSGGAQALTLSVTSGTGGGDNTRAEKVTISKEGDTFNAQRDGEAAVYVLDAKSVDELQKAISGIKPYTAPKDQKKK